MGKQSTLAAPLLLGTLAAGCATGPPPVFEPAAISVGKGSDTLTVFMNRQNGGPLASANANLLFDGDVIGTIGNGQCVRLTLPAGNHNLTAAVDRFGSLGGSMGQALASAFNSYNVQGAPGQTLYFEVKPHYDSPQVGWLFYTSKVASGRTC